MQYTTLACLGPDAQTFLQGQLSCDLRTVRADRLSLSCYCNLKGRVVAAPYLYAVDEGYHLILPADLAPSFLASLSKISVFSKVKLEDISQAFPAIPVLADTPFEVCTGAGFSLHSASPASPTAWAAHLITHSIPTLALAQSGLFLPHYLGMVELGAISFTKGCYLGQEIVARMHYKGNLKKHLVSVVDENLPEGEIVNQVVHEGKTYTLILCERKTE